MGSNQKRSPADTANRNTHHRQSGRCMFFGFVFMLAVALYLLFSPACLWAAPFAKYFQFTQPDGVQLTLWGEGDEFHAVFETTTGYTVVFDPGQKAYFYAERAADGKSLISSGVLAHGPAPPGLAQHVRMDHDAVVAAARARRKQWDAETGLSKRWSRLKSQTLGTPLAPDEVGVLPAPPETPTIGTKTGLTLLIDFSDAPATVSQTEIEGFLNGDTYAGFGNNGSVKKYFSDVSASRLTYTNVVTIYVRMTQPKSFYNDTSKDCGTQGRLLINDALAILKARSDYNSTILPTFSSFTTDDSGNVVGFNVFFAGADSGVWSYGLWPHSWILASSVPLGNGKSVSRYQITNVGTSLELGTFCHENGHMLCGFPDIYDYDYDSSGGAGVFCLMNSGGHGTNPVQVNAYLKLAAGWATATDLDSASNLTGTVVAAPNSGFDNFYRYRRPGVTTEYFLLENRQKTGRDANLPAAGIAIWHIDELGDKNNQSLVPNPSHLNYEVTLVQADNQWHFENYVNSGDALDLYYQGNTAAAYANRLDDSSTPHAHWWDGTTSAMNLNSFSIAGASMTFKIETGGGLPAPVLSAEPSLTPGTENTIYWSAVSPQAGIPLAVGSPLVGQSTSKNLVSTSAIAGVSVGAKDSGRNVPQHPLQPVAKTLTSDDELGVGDRSEPAQATLPLESVYVPRVNGEKAISTSEPIPAPMTVFSETFEGEFPGTSWTLYGSPTWNDVSYDKHGGSWSGWCGGSSLNPANGYIDNMNAWMVYGPFSLADAASASVSFWYKNLSESGFDYFKWMASVDGANFWGYQISGDQNSWRSQVFDLTNVYTLGDLRGQPQVWIAFVFTSDVSNSGPTYTGAYVDDIVITKDPAGGTVDLTPYQPLNWNDKIPVGTTQLGINDAHSYSGVYNDNQTLYFNWASINQGTAASGSYTVHAEVTGTGGNTWNWTIPSDAVNEWWGLTTDQAVGPLAAGSHTFKVWVDYSNTVGESNESNNYYERTITVSGGGTVDLTPYQPLNWNDKIPVGTTQLGINDAHSYSGVYNDNQTLYFNWASINQGTAASGSYTVHAEVTGTGGNTWNWTIPSDAVNEWWGLTTDQAVGPLAAGSHTFKVWVDYNNTVGESNESNNYYERTITVAATAVSYYAECADNSGFSSPSNSGWITQTSTTFQNLTPGQTYWYRVKAKSGITESGWSNIEYSQQEPLPSGTIQLSAATYSVNENGVNVTITATRTGGNNGAVGVSYATSNGTATAGSDYPSTSGTLSWANGDTANKTFSIPITNDTLDEPNETFTVTLTNPTGGATLGSPSSATVTITDNDPTPTVQFSAASSSGSEATTPASITVTLSAASGQTVTVNYATANGTATAGSDYTATTGTLTFNPGVTSRTISVPITNDTAVEPNETFTVTLSSPVNATLGAITTHTYTINNDDNAGAIQFSSATYSVNENGGSVLITVTRAGVSTGAVGVSYATSNGTATAGSDYTSTSGTLSWANGDTANKTFSVPILDDSAYEGNETVNLTLGSPTGGATLGSPSTAVLTIVDKVQGDFDGDGKTDIAVYRGSNGAWYVIPSGGGAPYGIGWGGDPSDKPVPGDYDGDGKTDYAVYRTNTGAWYVKPSGGSAPFGFGWGGDATDKPAPGDYDGDGKTDYAVYRTGAGAWYVYPSGGGSAYGVGWGGDATDKPTPGDYDGDGKTDIAVYRTGTGAWYVYPSGGGSPYGFGWGGDASDRAVPGDYDGDGKTDIAIYRADTGAWYVYPSGGGSPYGVGFGGDVTDLPVVTNPAVYM